MVQPNSSNAQSSSPLNPSTHGRASTDSTAALQAGQRLRGTQPPAQSLQTQLIRKSKSSCLAKAQKFLPADTLDSLIKKENINSVLPGTIINTPDLIPFILNKAKKTFATLVCIGKVSAVSHFYDGDFTDEDLPVAMQDIPDEDSWNVRTHRAGSDTPTNGDSWALFNHSEWTFKDVLEFTKWQWNFLAPVFTGCHFEYNLHTDCPLPFMAKERELTNSFFSTVYEIEIHPAHIDFLGLVGRILNPFCLRC
jgi:hypothetical protein